MTSSTYLEIEPVTIHTVTDAKKIVLTGLLDYFSEIDTSQNPDLHNILQSYTTTGSIFVVGMVEGQVVCTGAIRKENHKTARICRMSVTKEYRQKGFAKQIIRYLEQKALVFGYTRIVIETTIGWEKPINLYKSFGYKVTGVIEDEVHFHKVLI